MSVRIGSSGDESPSFACVARCFRSSCCSRCSCTQIYMRERSDGTNKEEDVMKEWGKKRSHRLAPET